MLGWVHNPFRVHSPSKAKLENRGSCMAAAAAPPPPQTHPVPQSPSPKFAALGRPGVIKKECYKDIVQTWPNEENSLPFVYHNAYNVSGRMLAEEHKWLCLPGLLSYQTRDEKKQKHSPQVQAFTWFLWVRAEMHEMKTPEVIYVLHPSGNDVHAAFHQAPRVVEFMMES
eukprot:1140286-Pelagomonas_calceolata.AAC.3